MKRTSFVWTTTACLLAPSLLYWQMWRNASDPYDDFSTWSPDTQTIRRELDHRYPVTPDGKNEAARRELFCELFKNRYRQHQPQIAVGLRILPGNRIKLMCPARMEPWNHDRLAMTAWRETREIFGEAFTLDIYETFIGATPHRIGKLRPLPDNPNIAQITYDFTTPRSPNRFRVGQSDTLLP
jgi:hypothetical protein